MFTSADVAWPLPFNGSAGGTADPPVEQSGLPDALGLGPQRKKLTVPVGVPHVPLTVAVSVTGVCPTTNGPGVLDVVSMLCEQIVKHSLVVASELASHHGASAVNLALQQ